MKNSFYVLIFLAALFGFTVLAQSDAAPPGVTFPVAELGNCASEDECAAYCDLPENMEACLDFAEVHGLISPEELAMARKMLELGVTAGPGGCRGQAECEAYCDDISHIEECLAFAEEYGLIPPEELEEGKKVAAAIRQGITPPNCKNKSECDVYCAQSEHMEECITFAEAAGLIPPEDREDAKKILEAIRKGVKPPPCGRKETCDIYCEAPEHFEQCITFAEAAGFVSPEEAAMVRKTGGKGPGNCRGKEECDTFCEDPANMEECINFALEFGFMSPEEAEQAKKMLAAGLTGGPGGCRGKEECEAYCNDIAHIEECVDFGVKAGFMPPEEAEMAKKMAQAGPPPGNCKGKEECDLYCQDPAHVEECIGFAEKMGMMPPEEAGVARRSMEAMRMGGPGGCKSKEECDLYCQDPAHAEECINFAVEQGFMSPEEAQIIREGMMSPPPGMPPPGGPPGGMPPEGMTPPEGIPPEYMPPEGIPQTPPPGGMPPPRGGAPPPPRRRSTTTRRRSTTTRRRSTTTRRRSTTTLKNKFPF